MTQIPQIIECPRDALQGWKKPIPTILKAEYLNALLEVGFHSIDFGSFVSPKAVPQMADTEALIPMLRWQDSATGLLAIVANLRGANTAATFEPIRYLGFPVSVSETFQKNNTGAGVSESLDRLSQISQTCRIAGKSLVVYISMAFGNPYGEPCTAEDVLRLVGQCRDRGADIISLADTVGLAAEGEIGELTEMVIRKNNDTLVGLHLHSTALGWKAKLQAAWQAGCRRFDGALGGYGGCPFAGSELVGNMDTDWLLGFLEEKGADTRIDEAALGKARLITATIFQ